MREDRRGSKDDILWTNCAWHLRVHETAKKRKKKKNNNENIYIHSAAQRRTAHEEVLAVTESLASDLFWVRQCFMRLSIIFSIAFWRPKSWASVRARSKSWLDLVWCLSAALSIAECCALKVMIFRTPITTTMPATADRNVEFDVKRVLSLLDQGPPV